MKYKLILAFALIVAFAFKSNDQKTILFFGDSLTAGYGLSKDQAFPAIVGEKLNAGDEKFKVINAGLSGETTAGGLNRIDWILREPVDIFVLELGANDGLRGLPLEQTRDNLQKIIDKVKAKNPEVKVVIAGMMVPPNLGNDYTSEFQKIFPEIAKKNNAVLIPFLLAGVAGDENLNLTDGIHPNPTGHRVVAENVLDALKAIL